MTVTLGPKSYRLNRGYRSTAAVKMEAEHSRVFESSFPTIDFIYFLGGFCLTSGNVRQYDTGNQRDDGRQHRFGT